MAIVLRSSAPRLIVNRAKVAYSNLKGELDNRGMPIEIMIEPTNHCNMNCPMCQRDRDNTISTRGLRFMEMSVFRKIVDEI